MREQKEMNIIFATGNRDKVREIREILGPDAASVVTMREAGVDVPVDENGNSFEENALIKARTVCKATGFATLADDSGLSVDILDGEPGVYSARYAMMNDEGEGDKDNNNLLLRRMKGKTRRQCAFQCAIALAIPGQMTRVAEGSCPGVLLEEERGNGGFGYDPLFLYEPLNKTFAEVTEEEKNAISHRARACEKMLAIIAGLNQA